MTIKITKRQQAVLDDIERHITEKGYGPTVREVCEDLGLSSPSTVHVHLKALEEKGFIKRDPLKSRSISLTYAVEQAIDSFVSEVRDIVSVPLVGSVAAGMPILAEENITDHLKLPTEIVGDAPSFMLSVRGDSMIEIGINNGDIVVALLEDEATIKRFYKESDHIRLQPENSQMEPLIVTDCSIVGTVVAVFRRI